MCVITETSGHVGSQSMHLTDEVPSSSFSESGEQDSNSDDETRTSKSEVRNKSQKDKSEAAQQNLLENTGKSNKKRSVPASTPSVQPVNIWTRLLSQGNRGIYIL
jgi:hypothetical protein